MPTPTLLPMVTTPPAPCESCGARVVTVSVNIPADVSSTGHAYWIRLCPACYSAPGEDPS